MGKVIALSALEDWAGGRAPKRFPLAAPVQTDAFNAQRPGGLAPARLVPWGLEFIASAPPHSDGPDGSEGRLEPRTNLFVMATMCAAGGSGQVKVRNLSSSGALVEGVILPAPGTPVRLSRGSLTVEGEIAWRSDGRAGLHFEAEIAVPDWLPNGKRGAGRQHVGEPVEAGCDASPSPDQQGAGTNSRRPTAAELLDLGAALVSLAEDLAGETDIVEHYSSQLQMLDVAAQTLARLASDAHLTRRHGSTA